MTSEQNCRLMPSAPDSVAIRMIFCVLKASHDGGLHVGRARSGNGIGSFVPAEPVLVNRPTQRIVVLSIQQDDLTVIAVRCEKLCEISLGANRLGEDDRLAFAAFGHDLVERLGQCGHQFAPFRIASDLERQATIGFENGDLGGELLRVDRRRWFCARRLAFSGELLRFGFDRVVVCERLDVRLAGAS